MNDEKELTVIEVYQRGVGIIEIIDPERIRIGTRTVGELREYGVNPEDFHYKKCLSCARKFPEHTLKLKPLKNLFK